MNLKAQIKANEEKLKQYRDFIDTIDLLVENKDDKKAIEFLLKVQFLEFTGRIERGEKNLDALKKQRMLEFELESAEANLRMDKLIPEISKWIGKDPVGVTVKIEPLVKAYESEKDGITQERRNELYLALKSHYEFLTKKLK